MTIIRLHTMNIEKEIIRNNTPFVLSLRFIIRVIRMVDKYA
jgi:hypothetical protein